jgi:membrane associated rhomboid family serine protease/Tfp pilus assembly protein PilF
MAKCVQCGRNMPSFSLKKKCAWCEQYEAAQRGEEVPDLQPVMPAPWQQNIAANAAPVTMALLAINFLVYILMVASGISATDPSGNDIIRWGANFGPYTFSGQYWRLISYMFVHIGIFHLLMNMWFLYDLGSACERLLGSVTYCLMYLIAGVTGGIFSISWHPQAPSAGASGALFGILGAMIAAYKFGDFSMPRTYVQMSLRSMLLCAGINLAWGMFGGIDNAAHIGGFVAGLVIGFLVAKAAPDTNDLGRRTLILALVGSAAFGLFSLARTLRLGPTGSPQRIAQLLTLGRRSEAIAELQKVVARNPNDPKWRMWLASAYSGNNEPDKAREQFEWLVAHGKPGDQWRDSAAFGIRYIYVSQKKFAEGEKYFETLVAQNPNDTESHFAIAELASMQNKNDQALAEFQKAASLAPNNAGAYIGIAQSYARLGKKSESIAAYQKAIELEKDPRAVESLKADMAAVEKGEVPKPKSDDEDEE